MQAVLYLFVISLIKFSYSHESDSAEVNRLEISPLYDTIIFSDVIDIINELNKNLNSPFNAFESSESVSDENIEDLLYEYQHYLDKAHEQRRTYLEKSNKTKNKVPLLRHENFVKTKLPSDDKYSNYYAHNYYNPNIIKFPTKSMNGPLDLFIPLNPALRIFNKTDRMNIPQRKDLKGESLLALEKLRRVENKPINLPYLLQKPAIGPFDSACYCKSNELPCKCNCKQCLIPLNTPTDNRFKPSNYNVYKIIVPENPLVFEPKLSDHIMDDMMNKANTLNVRIKVDVQLPKMQDGANKYGRHYNHNSGGNTDFDDFSKEFGSSIRLPSSYFNFPIPMDVFGYKKNSKINGHDSTPMHKITINKKKKSRSGSNCNKKHRKKLITFHNIKLSPSRTIKPMVIENYNTSNNTVNYQNTNKTRQANEYISTTTINVVSSNFTSTSTELPILLNTTQMEESIYFMVNISNNSENETDDGQKTGNSIELEFRQALNVSTEIPMNLREKRDISALNRSVILKNVSNSLNVIGLKQQNKVSMKSKKLLVTKKSNRSILPDMELLYWPSNMHNQSIFRLKNITDIILEQENKKAKLNMTKDAIRNNHTVALEQAIFGNVDWNDVDTVAPTFISFVGKYINGILTFCSEKTCHSMKCGNKTCVHRTCTPEQRYNHVGHCNGCQKTDSLASMESIMDLPSNVAFEIVDILQDRMLGKLYGKVTLCISSKCITFVTSKKTFIKSKCSTKSLIESGHCPNIKKL